MKNKLKRIAFVLVALAVPVLFSSLMSSNPKVVLYSLVVAMIIILLVGLWNLSGLLFEDKE